MVAMDSPIIVTHEDHQETLHYFLDCVLRARIETDNESNRSSYDEDVNIYLADLLSKSTRSKFLLGADDFQCKYDSQIADRTEACRDRASRYTLYKNNADFYLLALTVFDGQIACRLPKLLRIPKANFVGRTAAYYAYASELDRRIHRKETGTAIVLDKLSRHLSTYITILSHVKEMYFNMHRGFSEGEWYHLQREVNEAADGEFYKKKLDEFLQAISNYRKVHCESNRRKLVTLSEELREFDPDFCAEIDLDQEALESCRRHIA